MRHSFRSSIRIPFPPRRFSLASAMRLTILAFCAAVSPNEVMSARCWISPLYILQTHPHCRQKWHVEFQFFRSFEHGRTKFLLIRRLGEARQDAF
jgi:hypothetical protein